MSRKLMAFFAFGFACGLPQAVVAQAFPTKPVKIVVPWTPGGGVDTLARIVQPKLAEGLGQPVLVDNKAGATGTIGVDFVAKSDPDGYTLIVGSPGNMSVTPVLNPKLSYKPLIDFAPVSMGVHISNILVVNPSLPANNVAELIALARAQPGKITYASSGVGSSLHLAGELLKLVAKIDMLHVPYKGTSQAMADVIGGQTQVFFSDPSALPHVKAGKLRALAQTTKVRSPSIPDLPTVGESGVPGFDVTNWYAFFAPAGTPPAVIARLSAEFVKVLSSPEIKSKLAAVGQDAAPSTPQQLGNFHKEDMAQWARVVEAAKIKLE